MKNEKKLLSVDLEKTASISKKFYVLFFILIMRKITNTYVSKGRNVKQEESVYLLFGFFPIHRTLKVINKA